MNYRKSEIFDNYAKIAIDQGLISQAEEKTNPRYDSLEMSDIEIMYGVKPNGKDEKHIVEQAHPDSLVVMPAHDKIYGLVENELERQDMMVYIARKPTTGNLGGKRYVQAQEELLNELVRVGFLLDQNEKAELMNLADSCSNRIIKQAFEPVTIAIIIGAIIALTATGHAVYKGNHPDSQGFTPDLDNVLNEITSKGVLNGALEDYPELEKTLLPFINNLQNLKRLNQDADRYRQEINRSLLTLTGASTREEKKNLLLKNVSYLLKQDKIDEVNKKLTELQELGKAVNESIPLAIKELQDAQSRYETSSSGWWESVKKAWYWLIQSDCEDALEALIVLQSSLQTMLTDVDDTKANFSKLQSAGESLNSNDLKNSENLQDLIPPESIAKTPQTTIKKQNPNQKLLDAV